MNVLLGQAAAAATWPVPWKAFVAGHPEQAAQLEVKWETEALLNNSWVARNDLPAQLVGEFAAVLFSLKDSAEGRALLAAVPVSSFEHANEQTYAPVAAFLQRFSQSVRLLE